MAVVDGLLDTGQVGPVLLDKVDQAVMVSPLMDVAVAVVPIQLVLLQHNPPVATAVLV